MKNISLLLLFVAPMTSLLAGTTGKIAGEVRDLKTGEPLIGATVVLEGTSLGAATNIEGYFVILNIPPGKYVVAAASIGYARQAFKDVVVQVDLTTSLDFQLGETVLEVGDEILVTAERAMVKKDLTSSEARVNAEEIRTLPVSEVSEILTLQSGITVGADGGIHIRGGRTSEVAYWVDGVSVSDVYDGSQAVQVDNNSVQELQVISGTFNAEYGQAMSGIVNIVTKDGDRSYHGNILAYTGGYVTTDDWILNAREYYFTDPAVDLTPEAIFYSLDPDPVANTNIEASLSGPVPLLDNLTFYLAGRKFSSKGWLYGNKLFNNDGFISSELASSTLIFDADGNAVGIYLPNNPVEMNGRERLSGQAKLTYQLSGSMKISLSGLASDIEYRDYTHERFLTPDGDVTKYDRGYNVSALWTHTLGSSAFYTLNVNYFQKDFSEFLYEGTSTLSGIFSQSFLDSVNGDADPTNDLDPGQLIGDPRYIVDPNFASVSSYEWRAGGTNNHQFQRTTETRSAKFDYTDQLSRLHQIKLGLEAKLHRLYLEDYNYTFDERLLQLTSTYVPVIPPRDGPLYQEYTREPIELSAYLQDKLEYERMIVNVGLRVDYFDPKGQVLADPADPNVYLPRKTNNQFHDSNNNGFQDDGEESTTLEERQGYWYEDASTKLSVSPRLGISYPITDQGILHFSYGHFLQIPSFIHLYQMPEYKVTTASGIQGVFGNPDLDPQKTVMYEFGLQQQLSTDLSFDATLFYRDTRDWVTTSAPIDVGDAGSSTSSYTIYINRDYANTRGVTISATKRPADLWSLNLAYTFQIAEGINSNADDELAAQRDNAEPARTLTPLDWDQTHTVNATLGFGEFDWGAYVIGRYGSGLPYTPVISQAESQGADAARIVTNNSRRRPPTLNFDVRLFKNFTIDPMNLSVFLKVLNLFDRRNEVTVYGETGRASATVETLGVGEVSGDRLNTVSSYIVRPDWYSEPREIQLGMEINF